MIEKTTVLTPSLFPVHSIEPLKLENNVLGPATIQPREAALADPLFEKLTRFSICRRK